MGAKSGRIRLVAGVAIAVAVAAFVVRPAAAQEFSCFPKKTCPRMNSCTEAVFHLRECGDRERDGDNDGIPCESLCGKTLKQMNDHLAAGL